MVAYLALLGIFHMLDMVECHRLKYSRKLPEPAFFWLPLFHLFSFSALTVALLAERPALAVVGCGAVGLGIANVVPILFSAAGRTPGVAPAAALAGVATMGYLGFLAGPPVIGLVADAAGLRTGLAVVGLLCAVIAGGASLARRKA